MVTLTSPPGPETCFAHAVIFVVLSEDLLSQYPPVYPFGYMLYLILLSALLRVIFLLKNVMKFTKALIVITL